MQPYSGSHGEGGGVGMRVCASHMIPETFYLAAYANPHDRITGLDLSDGGQYVGDHVI